MAELTTKRRNDLPASDFALPGRRYPIPNKSHGRNALARVSANGSPEEKKQVRAAVYAKFKSLKESRDKRKAGSGS